MVLYVAVVCDTDGSAFITKAEFDSLKNNFQAQIDNYNQSIDSKIDGAIASYLAGIKVNTDDRQNKFVVYGHKNPNLFQGRTVNDFRLTGYDWTTFSTEKGNKTYPYGCVLRSLDKTNFGYGAGWWTLGYNWPAGSGMNWESEKKGFCVPATYANYHWVRVSTNTSSGATFTMTMHNEWPAEIYNYELTKKFGIPISILNPSFPIFDCVDRKSEPTDFHVSFVWFHNGYAEDLGTEGGSNNPWGGMNTGASVYLQHTKANGTSTNVVDIRSSPEKTLIPVTISDFELGDRLSLFVKSSEIGSNGDYSLFYFTNSCPGWVEETE